MKHIAKPWKYDVDILFNPQYTPARNNAYYDEEEDRIWLQASAIFAAESAGDHTDAYAARSTHVILVSEDKGLTWEITDCEWPAPPPNRTTLPDGTILEFGSNGWERHPRSDIGRLTQKGYFVWDLGEEAGYCAIIYNIWMRRSTDSGRTWEEKPIHEQLPFFAHLVCRFNPTVLDDGALVFFAYGYGKEARYSGSRSSAYYLRSTDAGDTWGLVMMADGKHSSSDNGFTEIFPVVHSDGRIFSMLRTELGQDAYAVRSFDGGKTWSQPERTPIRAKHPDLRSLKDGSFLCTYQRRFQEPLGIRARFTSDMGQTWSEEVVIRDGIPISNGLASPLTLELSDGTLFTLFNAQKYIDDGTKKGFIGGSRWTRDYRRAYGPELPVPPLTPKFNVDTRNKSPWQVEREQAERRAVNSEIS